jgi:hypothetical protein
MPNIAMDPNRGRRRRFAGLAGALFLTAALPAAAQDRDMAGVAAGVYGSVQVAALSETVGRSVDSGDEIFLGDRITSAPDSGLQLLLLDETVFTVGPNAELVVDEFVYDPATNAGRVSAQVLKGAFRFTTGLIGQEDPESVSIGTPIGTIGIRGTIVAGIVSGDEALIVLVGPGDEGATKERVGRIEVSNGGGSVTISRGGYGTVLRAGGAPPSAPVPVPDTTMNAILAAVGDRPAAAPAEDPAAAEPAESGESGTGAAGSGDAGGEEGGTRPRAAAPEPAAGSASAGQRPAPATAPTPSGTLSAQIGGLSVAALSGAGIDQGRSGSANTGVLTAAAGGTEDTITQTADANTILDGVTSRADLLSVPTGTAEFSGSGTLTGTLGSTGSFSFSAVLNFGKQTGEYQLNASWSGTNAGSIAVNATEGTYDEIMDQGDTFSSYPGGGIEPFTLADSSLTVTNAESATVRFRARNVGGTVAAAMDTSVVVVDTDNGSETLTGSASATR